MQIWNLLAIFIAASRPASGLYPHSPNCTHAYPGIFTTEQSERPDKFVIVQCGNYDPPEGGLDLSMIQKCATDAEYPRGGTEPLVAV